MAYVSHSAIGNNKSCASPGFNSVQAAVDAVPANGTVYLCGAVPFDEQVFLGKSVTVTGDPGRVDRLADDRGQVCSRIVPASRLSSRAHGLFAPQAIVVVTGAATKATIKGIDVHGPLPGNGGCANREYGVLVLERFPPPEQGIGHQRAGCERESERVPIRRRRPGRQQELAIC